LKVTSADGGLFTGRARGRKEGRFGKDGEQLGSSAAGQLSVKADDLLEISEETLHGKS
jgi:hypothetical protein